MSDAQRFMQQFVSTWGDAACFPDIYEPEAIIRSPAVRHPVAAGELAELVHRTKALLPDAQMHVERWAAAADFVLIEWQITATFAGEPLDWAGMSRFTLRGARAVEEAVHFDTLALWERLDPTMRRPGLLEVPAHVDLDNVAVLSRYYAEVWNRGDVTVLEQVVSDEVVGHDPAIGDFGFEQLQQLVVAFRGSFPDFHVIAEDVVAQGDRVALRFHSTGTFLSDFMGASPTGKQISTTGLVMYRFKAHKIVEIWMGWDPGNLRGQIGAIL